MSKSSNSKRSSLGGGVKASHNNDFCDFASRHSELYKALCRAKTSGECFCERKPQSISPEPVCMGAQRVAVSESINLINQNDISNVTRHSERSEESPELSDSTSESKVIARSRIECGMTKGCHSGNHVIAKNRLRFCSNLIKSIANAIEPMGLLRRFVPYNDRLKKCAFTLAELMITIGIVGVVAAITIPLLIQNSNYKKFTTQFRKSLSTLNQAAISAQAQYDMDYGMITSESAPSTCATDSLSGGQSTMCALLNNTLAGKTYMGVYGEVAGSMILTKYQFTKKTDGFDPTNFLIYSMADGSIVGFNPSMKNCSLSGELTKSVLTDSNKLANCIGFIDVNGVSLPNKEVTCSDGTSALEPNNPCTLKSKPWGLGDVFPVVFHNGTVEPATNAAKAFFSGGKSENGSAVDDESNVVLYSSSGEPQYYKLLNGNYYRKNSDGNYVRSDNSIFYKNSDGNYELRQNPYTYLFDNNMNSLGVIYRDELYEHSVAGWVKKDSEGNYVSTEGVVYIKNSDDNYERNGIIYDKNLNPLRRTRGDEWYEYKSGYYVKEASNGDLISDSNLKFKKGTDGNYTRGGGTVTYYYNNDLYLYGYNYLGQWYERKLGGYVRTDSSGNYVNEYGTVYSKRDDGYYEKENCIYDRNLIMIKCNY